MHLDPTRLRERLEELWISEIDFWAVEEERGRPALSTALFLTACWELCDIPDSSGGWIDHMLSRRMGYSPHAHDAAEPLARILDAGVARQDLVAVTQATWVELISQVLRLLDGQQINGADDGAWQLFEIDEHGRPQRPIQFLSDLSTTINRRPAGPANLD